MTVRIGITGFGRMGRLAFRAAWARADLARHLEIVHINEAQGGPETAAHLLEFDTVHGRWDRPVTVDGSGLAVEGRRVGYSAHDRPADIPWSDLGVDIVVECTGAFRTPETLQPHFANGARKVVVSAPVKEGALNIVQGINDDLYDPEKHDLVTAASCTTNCLAPVVKVVLEGLGIARGVITTIHDVTNTQVMVDIAHKDLRRARSGLNSLIPTSTGSATAITMIYPQLAGKLNGLAVRVPLLNASLTDAVFEVGRPTTADEVNALFRAAAEGPLKGILGYEDRPLVSADYVNDPRSGIVDGPATLVVDGTQVKVLAWYDNEWGYVNRMMELTAKVAALM
ncbi:MAG: ArsJ-associated glyceraldehyde-3-phosphate dehydrogenase [Rhodobacterales bacterium]|nr:ArsJ-associated glyceraldehyde-3-phosphate dehydrogenase [Rhodobacterales bacterium]